MKVNELLELLKKHDPEMDVLLVHACPKDGVVSLLPDGTEPCRQKSMVVPFLRIADVAPGLSVTNLYGNGEVEFLALYPGETVEPHVEDEA